MILATEAWLLVSIRSALDLFWLDNVEMLILVTKGIYFSLRDQFNVDVPVDNLFSFV